MRIPKKVRTGMATSVLGACACAVPWQTRADDIASMSLQQLMNEPVTSVSKKPTRLSESAAAITVVTQEDIRRLGITSLPDALRLVPGLDVAQVSSNEWAISSRGFNNQFSTKLLVLIDGRTVYTPASAAVFWNSLDLMMEDIDRIEVIRGPGATLWGANAVNGVINVITKRAQDTEGVLLSGLEGSGSESQFAAHYGTKLGPDADVRVYAKYLDQSSFEDSSHRADTGDWHTLRSGFRADWQPSNSDELTFQGDAYTGNAGTAIWQLSLAPFSAGDAVTEAVNNGSDLLQRWTHSFSADSALSLQTYFDHDNQGDGLGLERRSSYDIDAQHRFRWGSSDLVWGLGFRASSVLEVPYTFNISWNPAQRDLHQSNFFIQDEVTLLPEKLRMTVGTKLENTSIDGWHIEPNIRFALTPVEGQMVWTAISRSTRTPALFELDGRVNLSVSPSTGGGPPVLVSVLSNPDLVSEELIAYEAGYRFTPSPKLTLDITTFDDHYRHLIVESAESPQLELDFGPPHILVPLLLSNADHGRSYGVEVAANWQVVESWKLSASYSLLGLDVSSDSPTEHQSPRQQAQLHSYLDLPHHVELNGAIFYVDEISQLTGALNASIPPYVRGDLGIVWRGPNSTSIGVWGRNLFQHEHTEFASQRSNVLIEVPRSVVAKVTWGF
jgi:iron complex outermembrane recepter protein